MSVMPLLEQTIRMHLEEEPPVSSCLDSLECRRMSVPHVEQQTRIRLLEKGD
jgi:hypothetical protein